MLKRLKVDGFRTLINTEVRFDPLTIMVGKNGAGKTTIIDSLQLLGNFARGGVGRAFGPPPWSLSWQRTKGIGWIPAVKFDAGRRTWWWRSCRTGKATKWRESGGVTPGWASAIA